MSVLGEIRSAGNINIPHAPTHVPSQDKGKDAVNPREITKTSVGLSERPKKMVHMQDERTRPRTVSAPSPKRPRQSAVRSSSGPPVPSTSTIHPTTSGVIPKRILEEEEEEEDTSPVADDLDLAWALRPPCEAVQSQQERGESFAMEELRREIGNLQLDMLRMGRNLKVSQTVSMMHVWCVMRCWH